MSANCIAVAFPTAELKALELSEGSLSVLAAVDSPDELPRLASERVPDLLLVYSAGSADPAPVKAFSEKLRPVPKLLFVSDTPLPGVECVSLKNGYAAVKARASAVVNEGSQTVIRLKDRVLDERIANIFLSAGIPPHIKGYRFLREAVKQIVADPDLINAITKELYPAVAKQFGTTPSKVERAIRHAIEVAWARGKIENINNIYGVKVFQRGEKPTNGELIALIADKLIIEYS